MNLLLSRARALQSNLKNPILKALNNPKSRSAAIAAKCCDCVGCDLNHLEPGFRTTIRECEAYHCPLHSFRPYISKTGLKENEASSERLSRSNGVEK